MSGDMPGEILCDICLQWKRENSATSLCKDCNKFICITCRKHHDEITSENKHNVVDLYADSKSKVSTPNLSLTEMCPRHPNEHIKFFCNEHNALCCNMCGFLEHRKCEGVILIEDMIKTFDVETKSKDAEARIRNMQSDIKRVISKVQENNENIKNDKVVILQQIRSLRAELNDKLQKLEDDLIASLEGNHKTEDFSLQTKEAKGQSLIIAIENDLTQLDFVMTHGSDIQKVILLHNMEKLQAMHSKAVSAYQEDTTYIKIGLEVNKGLRELMNDLSDFGQIKVIRTKSHLSPCPVITASLLKAGMISESCRSPLKGRKAVKIAVFNVKLSGDNASCYILDVLTLQGTKHILLDHINSKIKVYGGKYQFQKSMTLQGNPWNACILPDNNIAVTLPEKRTILVIGIRNKMHKVREIRTRLQCRGIAVLKDQLLITTYDDEHSVLLLDMTGHEIRTVRPDNYQTEKLLNPLYVKINTAETVIYISYNGGHKMVAYSTSWNVLFTYTDQQLAYPYGVDTDREGNIYLCGCISYNVQQISADGRLIKTLINKEKDRKNPLTIRFYGDMDRFTVTYGHCDVVEVYDMRD